MNLLGSRSIHIQEEAYNKPFHIEISSEDCEHRYFHLQAIEKNRAKIRISPLKMFN